MNDEVFDLQKSFRRNYRRQPSRGRGALERAFAAPGSFRGLKRALTVRRQRLGQQGVEQAAAGRGGGAEARHDGLLEAVAAS